MVGVLPLIGGDELTGKKKEGGGVWIIPRAVALQSGVMRAMRGNLQLARVKNINDDLSEGVSFRMPNNMLNAVGQLNVAGVDSGFEIAVDGHYSETITADFLEELYEEGIDRLDLLFVSPNGLATGVVIILKSATRGDIFIF